MKEQADMTDNEIIENLHKAIIAHEAGKKDSATTNDAYLHTYNACAAAEKALKDRFGNDGWKRYRERHPSVVA